MDLNDTDRDVIVEALEDASELLDDKIVLDADYYSPEDLLRMRERLDRYESLGLKIKETE